MWRWAGTAVHAHVGGGSVDNCGISFLPSPRGWTGKGTYQLSYVVVVVFNQPQGNRVVGGLAFGKSQHLILNSD